MPENKDVQLLRLRDKVLMIALAMFLVGGLAWIVYDRVVNGVPILN